MSVSLKTAGAGDILTSWKPTTTRPPVSGRCSPLSTPCTAANTSSWWSTTWICSSSSAVTSLRCQDRQSHQARARRHEGRTAAGSGPKRRRRRPSHQHHHHPRHRLDRVRGGGHPRLPPALRPPRISAGPRTVHPEPCRRRPALPHRDHGTGIAGLLQPQRTAPQPATGTMSLQGTARNQTRQPARRDSLPRDPATDTGRTSPDRYGHAVTA
ncbi:hypothetical protein AHiyo1_01980 [Arthrobacter sp. Hiyo1]|nr:hypothetical protein AHiyo1_01980 [Arthrobacter sp. Hiyo1]